MRSMNMDRLRATQAREKAPLPGAASRSTLKPASRSASGSAPGPSRWTYRVTRAWKKPLVRQLVLGVLPLAVLVGAGLRLAADADVHAWVGAQKNAVIAKLSERPEFAIQAVHVAGASEEVTRAVVEVANVAPGMSSLRIKVAALKAEVEKLGAVKAAHVTLASDGVLKIHVTERIPAALWRTDEDLLWLVDREGALIQRAITRRGYPELPVVLGTGAPGAVAEALDLMAAGDEVRERLRAFVRVGERRWDLVLNRDLRIMLPEREPGAALSRVMAWHYGEDVLDRGLTAIDLRVGARPVLRMTEEAAEAHRLRSVAGESGEDT